jgi:hypothetical protein
MYNNKAKESFVHIVKYTHYLAQLQLVYVKYKQIIRETCNNSK